MECIALSHLPLNAADEAALLAPVNENLCHPNTAIQDAAAAALHAMSRPYLQGLTAGPAIYKIGIQALYGPRMRHPASSAQFPIKRCMLAM